MTADLTAAEAATLTKYQRATVQRFESAPDAEESARVRVAQAIADDGAEAYAEPGWADLNEDEQAVFVRYADAAIAAMHGLAPAADPCRHCGSDSVTNEHHVYGVRKCCPDCDHRPEMSEAGELRVRLQTVEADLEHVAVERDRVVAAMEALAEELESADAIEAGGA